MRLWQRLLDLINPPAYPEYQEYRDQEEAENAPFVADDSAVKIRRLKGVAAFAVVLSLAGGAWLYSQGTLFVKKPKLEIDPNLATEMLKEIAPEEKKETLDDVKRWAQQLEASVVRDVMDTRPAMRGPFGNRPAAGGPASQAPYEPYEAYEPYVSADTPSAPEQTPVAVAPEPAPAPVIPRALPPEPPATDTPEGRYQPRRYDPVVIEPRTVDPY